MSKAEILKALANLSASDLVEVQAKIDELTGETWSDPDGLSNAEIEALEAGLDEYRQNRASAIPWEVAREQILSKLRS